MEPIEAALIKSVAQAIWGDDENERLMGDWSAVPFEEAWTRQRYLHLRQWLENRARAVIEIIFDD